MIESLFLPPDVSGLIAALAIGLLIGLERGWNDRELPEGSRVAGLRTFTLTGLLGGVLGHLQPNFGPWPLVAAVLGLSLLLTVSYARTAKISGNLSATTTIAMLLTLVLGAYASHGNVTLALTAAVIVAVFLDLKPTLHGWLRLIEHRELTASLQLLVLSVVILPYLPNTGMGPFAALNPYQLWWAVILSLGEMLQNIAHQWRQPLGSLMMIIQSFESKFHTGKLSETFITSRVADAHLLSQNMSDTLEDFRTFFNPNRAKKAFSIKEVIQKAIDLSKYQLEKEEITLELLIKNDLEVFGFKNELIHVLLNLIGNSKDVLSTKSELKTKIIHIIARQTKETIFINVIDNGGGIKSDIISKVFDPYFTTKHKSVGTGIGLYMSKQMVEKHMNGKIGAKNIRHKLGTDAFFACTMFTLAIPKKNDTIEDDHEQA